MKHLFILLLITGSLSLLTGCGGGAEGMAGTDSLAGEGLEGIEGADMSEGINALGMDDAPAGLADEATTFMKTTPDNGGGIFPRTDVVSDVPNGMLPPMGENTDGVLLAQALPNSNTDKARALQHAYGVAPRTSDGRGTKSSIPSLNGPSTNRVGSVNKQQNSRGNRAGYANTIINAEHGGKPDREGYNAYNKAFTGRTFDNSRPHPDVVYSSPSGYSSAAHGAYQFMPDTWRENNNGRNAPMTRRNQDSAAMNLVRQTGVNPDKAPQGCDSYHRLSPKWASIPKCNGKSYHNQPVKTRSELNTWFNNGKRRELGDHYHDAPGADFAR